MILTSSLNWWRDLEQVLASRQPLKRRRVLFLGGGGTGLWYLSVSEVLLFSASLGWSSSSFCPFPPALPPLFLPPFTFVPSASALHPLRFPGHPLVPLRWLPWQSSPGSDITHLLGNCFQGSDIIRSPWQPLPEDSAAVKWANRILRYSWGEGATHGAYF